MTTRDAVAALVAEVTALTARAETRPHTPAALARRASEVRERAPWCGYACEQGCLACTVSVRDLETPEESGGQS
jgi:hypothetical protein